jgi:UDP-3-O-[3-hydroxymyristoyl] glucosamine N-acyltransferase
MKFTVGQIAHVVGGAVEGDAEATVSSLAKIEEAGPGSLAFLANAKYEPFLYSTRATAVIVSPELPLRQAVSASLIRVADPYSAFTKLLEFYAQATRVGKRGVEQPSFMGEGSTIGPGHYRGAKIYADTVIGQRCVIKAGAVVGTDGFGFAPQPDGSYKAIPQIGNVVLEDDVSIGANATVDCATMGSTVVRQGAKIDNLVQLAHNVEVGRHTVIAAQTGISGSSKIGDYCVLAGQVGIAGHLTLANKTTITAQAGVGKSVRQEGLTLQGSTAFDFKQNQRAQVVFRRLPELEQRVVTLEKSSPAPDKP